MRRTQSSDSRPTVPGARIRALLAAARPPAPRRDRRPAQALGPCRQGARVSAVTAPGSGRPPRSWSPAASPTHRGPSCDRARGSRNGGTRALRRSPKTPGLIDTGCTNERCERVQRCQAPPMRSASRGRGRILARGARAAPADPLADGAEAVPLATRADPCGGRGRCERGARCSADEGSDTAQAAHAACHYLGGGPGRSSRKRVVTGGKSGLRASGGKGSANNIPREAFVTAWYGAAIHRAARGSVVG